LGDVVNSLCLLIFMKRMLIGIILACLAVTVMAIIFQQSTFAQKITDTPFLTYDGSNFGFKINYPKDWKVEVILETPTFVAPSETFTDKY
jgi:hypothetical protein